MSLRHAGRHYLIIFKDNKYSYMFNASLNLREGIIYTRQVQTVRQIFLVKRSNFAAIHCTTLLYSAYKLTHRGGLS